MISDFFKKPRNRKITLIVILLGIIAIIIFSTAKIFMKPKINEIRLKEDFQSSQYTGLDDITGILHPIGYYNLSLNQNLFRVDPSSNTLETVSGLTQSNDLNTIFMLLLFNNNERDPPIGSTNNNRYSDYMVFPLKNSLYVGPQPEVNSIVSVNSATRNWNNFMHGMNMHPFRFIEINGRNYIRKNGSNDIYFTASSTSNKVMARQVSSLDNLNENQELLLQRVDNVIYHDFETGYYKFQINQDEIDQDGNRGFHVVHDIRLERVHGELNTYNIVEFDKSDPNYRLPNANYERQTRFEVGQDIHINAINDGNQPNGPNMILHAGGNSTNKNDNNNKWIIHKTSDIEVYLTRKNDLQNYYSLGGYLVKYERKVGLIDPGYHFISYKVGTDTYLVTHQDNKLVGVRINGDINNITIPDLVKSSNGDNMFVIKSIVGSQHSIQVADKELFVNLNNNGSGDYSLGFSNDPNGDGVRTLNIYKETGDDNYTMNYMIPNQNDTNSPNNSINIYIKRNNDELSIDRNNIDSMDSATRFSIHYINPSGVNVVNDPLKDNWGNNVKKQYAFYNQFIQIENPSGIRTIHSINDTARNPYQENELRSYYTIIKPLGNNTDTYIPIDNQDVQGVLSDRLPYSPDFVDGDGQYKESEYQNQFSRDGNEYRSSSGTPLPDKKTIYECKNECQTDPDCDKFLFEIGGRPQVQVGNSNKRSEAYKGNCVLVNSSDVGGLSSGEDYSGFSKLQDVMTALPTQTEPVATVPPVINNKDESCTIRGPSICEDKDYCYLKGNNCLRKCPINPLNGTSQNLERMDTDLTCIGTLNDFDIVFQEIDRDFNTENVSNSITVKLMDINLINITKRVHKPILNYNNGLMVRFVCIGNNARDTDFELPINYSLSNSDYAVDESNSKLILGTGIDQINIQVPEEVVQCSSRGYKLVLKIKLTDIYNYSKVIDVIPMDTENNIMYDIESQINGQEFTSKMMLGRSIYNAVQSSLDKI